jgi:hypothetical protein
MRQFLGNTDERKLSLVRLCARVLGLRRRVGMIAR